MLQFPDQHLEVEELDVGMFEGEFDDDILYSLPNLTSFTVDVNNSVYSEESGIIYNKEQTELIKIPPNYNEEVVHLVGTVKKIRAQSSVNLKNVKLLYIPSGL